MFWSVPFLKAQVQAAVNGVSKQCREHENMNMPMVPTCATGPNARFCCQPGVLNTCSATCRLNTPVTGLPRWPEICMVKGSTLRCSSKFVMRHKRSGSLAWPARDASRVSKECFANILICHYYRLLKMSITQNSSIARYSSHVHGLVRHANSDGCL